MEDKKHKGNFGEGDAGTSRNVQLSREDTDLEYLKKYILYYEDVLPTNRILCVMNQIDLALLLDTPLSGPINWSNDVYVMGPGSKVEVPISRTNSYSTIDVKPIFINFILNNSYTVNYSITGRESKIDDLVYNPTRDIILYYVETPNYLLTLTNKFCSTMLYLIKSGLVSHRVGSSEEYRGNDIHNYTWLKLPPCNHDPKGWFCTNCGNTGLYPIPSIIRGYI